MFDVIPLNGQTWLICGGRDFADQGMFDDAMYELTRRFGMPEKVIHGAQRGADTMGEHFVRRHGLTVRRFRADWRHHGKAAGPIRNQQMIDDGKPKLVIAFPGGNGTADMVAKARKAGIDVAEIKPTAKSSAAP
jgi:hypothetical protein